MLVFCILPEMLFNHMKRTRKKSARIVKESESTPKICG